MVIWITKAGRVNDGTEEGGQMHFETVATLTYSKKIGGKIYLRVCEVLSRLEPDGDTQRIEVLSHGEIPIRKDWISYLFASPKQT